MSLYCLCFSVNVSVCLVCCVHDNVCELFGETIPDTKQFPMCLAVVSVLLLNVMYVFSVEVLCCIDCIWSSTECACCACDPSVHLSVPSICFVCVFVCRKLSHHLRV